MVANNINKEEILQAAQKWFRDVIATNHEANLRKIIKKPSKLHINPFLATYLANFLTGNNSAESVARAILYPHILGTSITTSFGSNLQKFIPYLKDALGNEAAGSTTSGIDIEFIDQVDGRKKYCQLKAGLQTINKDDVTTIHHHFRDARNLARQNGLNLSSDDLVVGILCGERKQMSANYKKLETEHGYNVFVGQEFWHRLTGDLNFYFELGQAFAAVARECDASEVVEEAVRAIAKSEGVGKLLG